jgi:hypothetical protein
MHDKGIMDRLKTGEPYFILRAQDKHTVGMLRIYASMVSFDRNHALQSEVNAIAEEFEEWQRQNKNLVKAPD